MCVPAEVRSGGGVRGREESLATQNRKQKVIVAERKPSVGTQAANSVPNGFSLAHYQFVYSTIYTKEENKVDNCILYRVYDCDKDCWLCLRKNTNKSQL